MIILIYGNKEMESNKSVESRGDDIKNTVFFDMVPCSENIRYSVHLDNFH